MNKDLEQSVIPHEMQSSFMRFQERDGELLTAIYEHDGVLSRRQLKAMFWLDKSFRALEKRLAKLKQTKYIAWPTPEQRRTRPIPEPVVWLDWRGISWIAGRSGISVEMPGLENESQLRKLEITLRQKGIHWVREPRWAQLGHDLAVIDFRLTIEKAVQLLPSLSLQEWVNESAFRSRPDTVEFEVKRKDGRRMRLRRGVVPDGYFEIVDQGGERLGSAARARFLLEIDMATHDNPSFSREKILPGYAYLLSEAYRTRFGDNSGRWLVVTTGERRLQNLKRQAEIEIDGAASAFYFTTFNQILPATILTAAIWRRGGTDNLVPLFTH